jgi:hypothetical protein
MQKELDDLAGNKTKLQDDAKLHRTQILKMQTEIENGLKLECDLNLLKNERDSNQALIAELQTGLHKKQAELEAANHSLTSVRKELDAANHSMAFVRTELDLSKEKLNEDAKHYSQQILELQKEEVKRDSVARKAEVEIKACQNLIAELKTGLKVQQAKTAELDAASKDQRSFLHFQLAVHQLLNARPNLSPHEGTSLRSPCSAAPPGSWLHTFGESVASAFVGTRASHRRNKQSPASDVCELPEYEVIGVDAVTNPDLAERQRQFIQQAESREPPGTHEFTAHRLVPFLPESMKLRRLQAGTEAFDERMLLGWHGASDEVARDITADGFNPCCSGSGAGCMFGKGLYTAENSSKADLYAGPPKSRFIKHTGTMCVILAAVYCGNMYEAKTSTEETRRWTKPPAPTAAQIKATGIKR